MRFVSFRRPRPVPPGLNGAESVRLLQIHPVEEQEGQEEEGQEGEEVVVLPAWTAAVRRRTACRLQAAKRRGLAWTWATAAHTAAASWPSPWPRYSAALSANCSALRK